METGAVIAIILVAVFVLTECRSPPHEAPPPYINDESCNVRLEVCTQMILYNDNFADSTADLQSAITNIDTICGVYLSSIDCVKSTLLLCDSDYRAFLVEELNSIESTCTEEGKSLLRAAQGSSCFRDWDRFYEVLGNSIPCIGPDVAIYSGSMEDRCQHMREEFACLVRNFTAECGHAAGRFIDIVTSVRIPPENECRSSSPSDVFKRSFEFLTKRR